MSARPDTAAPNLTALQPGPLHSRARRLALGLLLAAAGFAYGFLLGPDDPSRRGFALLVALLAFAPIYWGRSLVDAVLALLIVAVLAPFSPSRGGIAFAMTLAVCAAVAAGRQRWTRAVCTAALAGLAIGSASLMAHSGGDVLRNTAVWGAVLYACIALAHWAEAHVPHPRLPRRRG